VAENGKILYPKAYDEQNEEGKIVAGI
jgi:hypothetical protein